MVVMSKFRVLLGVGLLLVLTLTSGAHSPKYLSAIEVLTKDMLLDKQKESVIARKFDKLTTPNITGELELGETIEDQLIILHPQPGITTQFRIEQQFETSLTIMTEDNYLELKDWKHAYSAWRQLKELERNRFQPLPFPEDMYLRFPRVTAKQIQAAVRKAGGEAWARLVRNVQHPNDYPSSVEISKILFRILAKEGGQWKVIHTLEFIVPGGC